MVAVASESCSNFVHKLAVASALKEILVVGSLAEADKLVEAESSAEPVEVDSSADHRPADSSIVRLSVDTFYFDLKKSIAMSMIILAASMTETNFCYIFI